MTYGVTKDEGEEEMTIRLVKVIRETFRTTSYLLSVFRDHSTTGRVESLLSDKYRT